MVGYMKEIQIKRYRKFLMDSNLFDKFETSVLCERKQDWDL